MSTGAGSASPTFASGAPRRATSTACSSISCTEAGALNILGVWDGHDAGAALLVDGRLVAAANEERFTRRKLEVRFPRHSIAACLRLGGIEARHVDRVAGSTTDLAKTLTRAAPWLKEAFYRMRRRPPRAGAAADARRALKYALAERPGNALTARWSAALVRRELRALGLDRAPLQLFDHHAAHAAAAASWSGEAPATVLTVDGVGDGASATVSRWRDRKLERLAATPARASLGVYFEHVTHLLGWRELEDEGKVMALAEYAPPSSRPNPAALVTADGLRLRSAAHGDALRRRLRGLRRQRDAAEFARLAQDALENCMVDWARSAVEQTGCPRLALAGGVASNVKVNQQLRRLAEVEAVSVFPHMGDGGLAAGAAICAAWAAGETVTLDRDPALHLGWGPAFSEEAMAAAVAGAGRLSRPDRLIDEAADLLERDGIILWFQGAMEYGPRALGQRSVLARPDRAALRDRLNLALKRREWFQPFCPTLLERAARAALEDFAGSPDRYMTTAYDVRAEYRDRLAGASGPDGSCRPQILPDGEAGPFAELLRSVEGRLGFGALLNTSFNLHGEPLVCAPHEAVDVFRRSGADALVIGPFLVRAAGGN
jgi:carbamoyltransferase